MTNIKKSSNTSKSIKSEPKTKAVRTTNTKRRKRISPREKERRNSVVAAINRMYRKSASLLIGEAVLFIATAAVLFFKPVLVLTIFTYIIGAALLLFGLYRMASGFMYNADMGGGGIDVVFGLINIVLGILFIVYPSGSLVSVAYICVILFFFKALRVLIFAINLARARFGHYVITLIGGIALFALAVALFFFPLGAFIAMTYYLAGLLLVYAFADIYMFVELGKLKQIVNE